MKIIISRKGFDNANGKCASPILPDGDMVSMPIPTEESSGLKFEEIFYQGRTYAQMWKELSEKAYHLYPSGFCHLDPDIREDVRSEKITWLETCVRADGSGTRLSAGTES